MSYGEATAQTYERNAAPPTPSAIGGVSEALEREVVALHEAINALENRLIPALGPSRPEAAGVEATKDAVGSPHVRKLREFLLGVTMARMKVEGILRRVEF